MSRLEGLVARRYELDVPLRYRRTGDVGWRHGRTVNASRSGVLFQAAGEVFDEGTAIEIQLELPGRLRPSLINCTGSVVRCERGATEGLRIAATIDGYSFGGGGDAPVPAVPSA
jgi:hypothetical protein